MKINLKKVYFLTILFCLMPFSSRAAFCSCSEKEDLLNYAKNNLKDRGLGEFSEEIIKKGLDQFTVNSNSKFTYGDVFSLSIVANRLAVFQYNEVAQPPLGDPCV
jgi:hypothetical protein